MSTDPFVLRLRALAELVIADRSVTVDELRHAAVDLDQGTTEVLLGARSRFERLRARERELTVLMSSLRELSEVRDVQPLLQKLVDRAHDLMGTDVTYLSEYDESTDELFVRANRGAVSEHMRRLRVPAGVGLASKVVQTRSPQWTAAYEVAGFRHDAEVTAAVDAEHMQSILGVPLIASDRVLGVLFAADRSTHGFGAEQTALLTAFADQAAVILQTARLLAAERHAAERAEKASAEAQSRALAMENSAALHEELTRLVLAGEGSEAVASTLSASLRAPVALADRDLRPLAVSHREAEACWRRGRLRDEVMAAVEESRRTARWVGWNGVDTGGAVASMAGRNFLGALLVLGSGVDDLERRTVERGAQAHALITMQRDAVADAEERVRGDLVGDLLHGEEPARVVRRAEQRGITLNRRWVPLLVAGWEQQRWRLTHAVGALDPDWLVAQHDSGALALVPDDDRGLALAEQVHRRLARDFGTGVVIAGDLHEVEAIPGEARSLAALARLLPGLGVEDGAVTLAAYAPYLAMFGSQADRARAFADELLAPVLEWDTEHGSDLVTTLAAFLDANGSMVRTAEALFVHPNTVKQRVERLGSLLGPRWREPETRFRLAVALRLHRMSASDI